MATAVQPVTLPDPQPENAKQAVLMVRDDHNWVEAKPDLNSTDGIKKNITALWAAINRLAAYVDGDKTGTPTSPKQPVQAKPYQAPHVQTEFERNQQPADRTQFVNPSAAV